MSDAFKNGIIHLDSTPVFVFYAGQIVSGSIMFELEEPITFSVIYMQFIGEATVSWTESEIETVNGVTRHKLVKYEGREEYFNYTYNLAGGGEGTSQLPTGRQEIPFKFQIPFTCPSSFKGEQGQISYTMAAHLVTPDHIHAHEVITKSFQVIAPFDLNEGSDRIKEPIDLEFEEMYGCCFSTDPVTIRVRLPVSGYCPGQIIPVAIQVENNASVEITKMIFEIFSKELYRSQIPQSEYIPPEKVLVTTKKGPVMGKSKRNFTVDLAVPEIIAPYLENCSIIDVGYFFRITIKLSGCNDDLQDEAEMCLGLIPVREFTEGEYVHPLAHSLPTVPIPDPNTTAELLLPPPTAGFRGSSTSLQRVQVNLAEARAYQNKPPPGPYTDTPPPYPYPSGPYPPGNKFEAPVSIEMKPKPFQDYDIGFKAPDAAPGGPGYPTGGPGYPTNGPGYPTSGPGYPTSGPGYPTSGSGYPTGGPGYPTSGPGYPTGGPGYPTNASRESNPPPYPTAVQMPGINNGEPPYSQGGFAPSAPPPSS